MDYRRTCGEDWREVSVIKLRAISGKDAVRAPAFQPVFDYISPRRRILPIYRDDLRVEESLRPEPWRLVLTVST